MLGLKVSNVPFSVLRHNNQYVHVAEGFGGRPIEVWPVYSFYKEYLVGDKSKAVKEFEDWYRMMLKKYSNVSNTKQGGFCNGSLYRLIERRSGVTYEQADQATIDKAIAERVMKRFGLLESIQSHGYSPDTERIYAVQKGDQIFLKGGHHRAAALRALGKDELPNVFVFTSSIVYNCFCFLRNLKIKIHANLSR